ncbi:N-acetylglucosamine-6-phosphate deacetylase [Halarsenatibacter silvermanii]|uniref:N-acetylglucosamine-6-phosphate deacetylase n=1 Tax=Halarsenatibacter silvermanii TaxID=321763 RepID=A0A1G9LTC4_9FIRM|nr:N-acetylglucosamine-6-phosphate deacetylase [Halarsenatibacter silvermanii]SDL65342.1 N-acetylglucosamine 6-phosphate deacetylase [Halarsenatibacter silvermanii]
MTKKILRDINVVGPQNIYKNSRVVIKNDRIVSIEQVDFSSEDQQADVFEFAGNYYALPGFIDIHIHGAAGSDITDGTPADWQNISRFKLSQGTTGYLGTILTSPRSKTLKLCRNLADFFQSGQNQNLIGVHMEGPFINREKKGAQNENFIRPTDVEELQKWHQLLGKNLKLISLAPELEGSLEVIEYAVSNSIVVGAVHSAASYERMQEAFSAGLKLGAHLFNGMEGFHHRRPGIVGAFLEAENRYVELIADGIHLHPAVIKFVLKSRHYKNTVLITDAMRACGKPDGSYDLGGRKVVIKEGVARTQEGNLAGSTLTMNQALKNIISFADLDLTEACKLVSTEPASLLGLKDRGRLMPGNRADIAVLDENLDVRMTFLGGRPVYDDLS